MMEAWKATVSSERKEPLINQTEVIELPRRRSPANLTANGLEPPSNNALEQQLDIPSKWNSYQGQSGILRRFTSFLCSASLAYAIAFAIMTSGMVYGVMNQAQIFEQKIDWDRELKVAFIGNSYLFVNDIPRLVQALSDWKIQQNSCLHASGSLEALLITGNGMYPRWKTAAADMDVQYTDSYGQLSEIYDYGLCTIPQMLQGYDPNITYKNRNRLFYNDGKNPCIRDESYLNFLNGRLTNKTVAWDYVVLTDQTKRMAVDTARESSVYALKEVYGPLIKASGAVPVIVDTHSFWSSTTNMSGLVDIPTFQSLIYEGVDEYLSALSSVLPRSQKPIVAPIGMAYLTVWEERYDLWGKLFLDDGVHSSMFGSYLFAIVLYMTVFGHDPPAGSVFPEQIEYLFSNCRKVIISGQFEVPTYDEATYLQQVARRVTLKGYVPQSMK